MNEFNYYIVKQQKQIRPGLVLWHQAEKEPIEMEKKCWTTHIGKTDVIQKKVQGMFGIGNSLYLKLWNIFETNLEMHIECALCVCIQGK